jgi:hypothetical protein
MAQNVADILGCDLAMAQGLLEAAGGDEAMAIELGLGSGAGADMMMVDTGTAGAAPSSLPYAHWNAIWPEATSTLPPSWKDQRLDDFTSDGGIIQPLNGPCGVLATVQGEMWLREDNTITTSSLEDRLTAAIHAILTRIVAHYQPENPHVIYADDSTRSVQEASKEIRTAVALLEAAASTVGPTKLQQQLSVGTTSLVEGPHWLCSSDLMCLLLRGRIDSGNIGAWDPETHRKWQFYSDENNMDKTLGMLSMMEIQEGIKVADDLKFDKQVWVVHTGDHFMTMRWAKSNNDNKKLVIFNGLKPVGPINQYYVLSGDLSLAKPAEDIHEETFKKKRPGQPDDIVQARKTDSTNYKDWTFEVVPAVDDPSVQGPLDDDPNEPVYNFDNPTDEEKRGPWRCASCYNTRFQTMNFGLNDAGTNTCSACGKTRSQAFWSLWLPYADLSPRMQRRARHMYAPKIELLISTLYPNADIVEEE